MPKSFRALIIVACLILTLSPAFSATAVDLGIIGVGARPLGMGKAGIAIADGANAIFTNPSGLALQESWSATCMQSKLMQKVDYKLLGGSYHTDYGTFGIGYIMAATPAGYKTTNKSSLSSATPINYSSSQLTLSYARSLSDFIKGSSSLGNLSLGVNLKLINNSFSGYDGSGSGQGIDLGLMLKPKDNVTIGAALTNVGGSVNWKNSSTEQLESKTKLGTAVKLMDNKLLVAFDTDLSINSSKPLLIHTGVEYKPLKMLALRAGIDQSPLDKSNTASNLTAGIGVKFSGFSFDYAYRQDAKLAANATHFFSLSFSPVKSSPVVVKKETKAPKTVVSQVDARKAKLYGTTQVKVETKKEATQPVVKTVEEKVKSILEYYK